MNSRNCTSLFLALMLLISNVGLAFNVHYCGGSVSSISTVYELVKDGKSCCAMAEKSGKKCCSNKIVSIKSKSDQVLVKTFSAPLEYFLLSPSKPVIFSSFTHHQNTPASSYYCDAHAPPLFQLYSQYIFYA